MAILVSELMQVEDVFSRLGNILPESAEVSHTRTVWHVTICFRGILKFVPSPIKTIFP